MSTHLVSLSFLGGYIYRSVCCNDQTAELLQMLEFLHHKQHIFLLSFFFKEFTSNSSSIWNDSVKTVIDYKITRLELGSVISFWPDCLESFKTDTCTLSKHFFLSTVQTFAKFPENLLQQDTPNLTKCSHL